MKIKKHYKTVDLFAGCGGLSLGFQNAGFNVVLAVDNWTPAVDVYKLNFDHPIVNLDLNNVNQATKEIKKYKPDIIIGGPPCQDFSHAGKRNENGGRADLTIRFAELIEKVKPKYFVMENVDRIESSNAYRVAIKILKQAGYGISPYLFDASLCGVPQKRKRFVVIGELYGKDNALLPYIKIKQTSDSMTIREYLGNSLGIDHYYRHPRNYNRRGIFSIDEPSPTIRGVNRPLPQGYKGHSGDSSPLTSGIRPLTTVERSYIQTFPKEFKFEGSKTNLEQMIGNAVPVKLAEFIANVLMEYDNDSKSEKIPYNLFSLVE